MSSSSDKSGTSSSTTSTTSTTTTTQTEIKTEYSEVSTEGRTKPSVSVYGYSNEHSEAQPLVEGEKN